MKFSKNIKIKKIIIKIYKLFLGKMSQSLLQIVNLRNLKF
jgi:hypothetical protein